MTNDDSYWVHFQRERERQLYEYDSPLMFTEVDERPWWQRLLLIGNVTFVCLAVTRHIEGRGKNRFEAENDLRRKLGKKPID